MSPVRQAVFLVGDDGLQCDAAAKPIPAPFLEVAPGVRFLDLVLAEAARHGFSDIVLLAGSLAADVEAAYHNTQVYGAQVSVLRSAGERLAPVFVLGDGARLFDINLRALAMDMDPTVMARLALRRARDVAPGAAAVLDGARIVRWLDQDQSALGGALTSGGVCLVRRDAATMLEIGQSFEHDLLPRLTAMGALEGMVFDGGILNLHDHDGVARARADAAALRTRPCAFLDRDGVLNVDVGYAHKPEDLDWMPGAREAVRHLNEAHYYVVVVTNQAGVARGYYPEEQVHVFHAAMADDLAAAGAHVDAWYHCPFHEDGVAPAYTVANHPDRKPNPGMLKRAMADWPIRREGSFLIGDKPSDIEAAHALGLPGFLYQGGDLRACVASAIAGL